MNRSGEPDMAALPVMRGKPAPRCILCGCEGTVAHTNLQDQNRNVAGPFSLRRCSNPACQILWQDPMPLAEEIHLAYRSYYTHTARPQDAQGGKLGIKGQIFEALAAPLRMLFATGASRAQMTNLLLDERPPRPHPGCGLRCG